MFATANVPFNSPAPGPFTLAHGLGMVPTTVILEFTDGGTVWYQPNRYDSENLYLVASDTNVTGVAIVFAQCGSDNAGGCGGCN